MTLSGGFHVLAKPTGATPEGEPGLNYLCAGYQRFATAASRCASWRGSCAWAARRRRSGATTPLATSSRDERNNQHRSRRPFPRTSGRKTRRCHGAALAR